MSLAATGGLLRIEHRQKNGAAVIRVRHSGRIEITVKHNVLAAIVVFHDRADVVPSRFRLAAGAIVVLTYLDGQVLNFSVCHGLPLVAWKICVAIVQARPLEDRGRAAIFAI